MAEEIVTHLPKDEGQDTAGKTYTSIEEMWEYEIGLDPAAQRTDQTKNKEWYSKAGVFAFRLFVHAIPVGRAFVAMQVHGAHLPRQHHLICRQDTVTDDPASCRDARCRTRIQTRCDWRSKLLGVSLHLITGFFMLGWGVWGCGSLERLDNIRRKYEFEMKQLREFEIKRYSFAPKWRFIGLLVHWEVGSEA